MRWIFSWCLLLFFIPVFAENALPTNAGNHTAGENGNNAFPSSSNGSAFPDANADNGNNALTNLASMKMNISQMMQVFNNVDYQKMIGEQSKMAFALGKTQQKRFKIKKGTQSND